MPGIGTGIFLSNSLAICFIYVLKDLLTLNRVLWWVANIFFTALNLTAKNVKIKNTQKFRAAQMFDTVEYLSRKNNNKCKHSSCLRHVM